MEIDEIFKVKKVHFDTSSCAQKRKFTLQKGVQILNLLNILHKICLRKGSTLLRGIV